MFAIRQWGRSAPGVHKRAGEGFQLITKKNSQKRLCTDTVCETFFTNILSLVDQNPDGIRSKLDGISSKSNRIRSN
jgi:hypothetical protein